MQPRQNIVFVYATRILHNVSGIAVAVSVLECLCSVIEPVGHYCSTEVWTRFWTWSPDSSPCLACL